MSCCLFCYMSCCLFCYMSCCLFLVIFLSLFSYVYYSVYDSNGDAFLCIIVFAFLFLFLIFLTAYLFLFTPFSTSFHPSIYASFVTTQTPFLPFPFLPFSISKDKTQDTLLKASLHPRLYEACVYVPRLSDVLTLLRMI
jgi:hypothetical protein